jgi:glucose-1-phosphate cytidylyltransferase
MKTVILAGGLGTRLSEETVVKPKPMVEIGGRPILWHIMKIYSAHGIDEFIICLGYKGYMLKEYFANYFLHMSDVTFDMKRNKMQVHHKHAEPWKVTLVDTGDLSDTGGRLGRVRDYVGDETFFFTYGDGIADVDVTKLLSLHRREKAMVTVTAVQPPGRYGALHIKENRVLRFHEKPQGDGAWVNGGYFVVEPEVFGFLENDASSWENDVLVSIAAKKRLVSYLHYGFWQAMDTLRDKNHLESLWNSGRCPWKVWK